MPPLIATFAAMEFTLADIDRAVRVALYRQFDNWSAGEEYWAEAVFQTDLVAYAYHDEKWYRLGYTFNPDAEPADRVTFADRSTWQEVTWAWVPVERDAGDGERLAGALRQRKLALFTAPDERGAFAPGVEVRSQAEPDAPRLGTYQRRTIPVEVRRVEGESRTAIIINTTDLDSHRTIVDPAGGEWDEFRRKFFINHDLGLLAGRSPVPELVDGNWVVTVDDDAWDLEDEQVARWFRKVKSGLCDEVSLGFRPIEGRWDTVTVDGREERVFRYTRWKGVEWSFVGMASNPAAVVTERAAPAEPVAEPSPVSAAPEEERAEPGLHYVPLDELRQRLADSRERDRLRRERAAQLALQRLGRA